MVGINSYFFSIKHKTQHAVITHANTSNNGIKIPTFLGKKYGDDVILVQCPLKVASEKKNENKDLFSYTFHLHYVQVYEL